METELFIASMKVINEKNFRPLILTKLKLNNILANVDFNEICFYLTSDRNRIETLTLKFGLINSSGHLFNIDGQITNNSNGLNLNGKFNFNNPTGTPQIGISNRGIKIIRIPSQTYFLKSLKTEMDALDGNVMIGFFVIYTNNVNEPYEVHTAILTANFGGGGGPGSLNTKPAP